MNRSFFRTLAVTLSLSLLLTTSIARAGGEPHSDFEVGRNDLNQLVIEGDIDILTGIEPIFLEADEGLLSPLYVAQEPGFENIAADEAPDFLALLSGHQVALQRLSFTSGLEMYQPPLTPILAADNATFAFVQDLAGDFHNDLIFAAPGPIGSTYTGVYQLVDLSGLHQPSEPFNLSFEVVPEPATCVLLGIGLAAARRRRLSR